MLVQADSCGLYPENRILSPVSEYVVRKRERGEVGKATNKRWKWTGCRNAGPTPDDKVHGKYRLDPTIPRTFSLEEAGGGGYS